MRKQQQKQILDIIATLYEANAEIKRLFLCGELSAVLQLLGDCQEGAVQIGNYIEILEGEGTKTVALLEEYHESLFCFGERIETIDAGFVKRLQKQLLRIENSVRSELSPDRIEVAFFPYKASMWDSLESIWLAAKEDPKCDAYVVPIPYFDRLPNGGLGQMRYEGSMYPDGIPVVDWRTYDLEERRPDVIFIHNPYDEGNLVTSVHPDYYSNKLKGFTELLCYVPYFVVSDDVQEHFVRCSGVLNADRVFLQSEKVRNTYVRVFKEFEKKNRCSGRFGIAETKFVALGSPKFDRVLNSKREECNLPGDWTKLTEARKVILYNTSVGALLQGGEQYLKKLRHVLDTFLSRSDVALWWRPHPLSEATYQSMRPHLLAEYEQIVEDYRHSGWGIYDDTPDLHRALTMSDALIGDGSSIMALYNVTGKPVMLLDAALADGADNDEREEFLHSDIINFMATPQGDAEWGFSASCNALYKISIENATAEYIASVPDEKNVAGLYRAPIRLGNKLFLAPSSAHDWVFYDISTGEWTKMAVPADCLPAADRNGAPGSVFSDVVYCDGYLLIIPGDRGVFAKYDIESGEITYYSEWFKKFQPCITNIARGLFVGLCGIDGKLFLCSPQCNVVTELEPDRMSFKYHRVGAAENQYCGITYIDDTFWLIKDRASGQEPWQDGLVEWHPESEKSIEHNSLPIVQDENRKGRGIKTLIPLGTSLYLLPYQSNDIIKYDTVSNQSEIVKLTPEYNYFARKSKLYTWSKNIAFNGVTKNKIVPYPWKKTIFEKSTILAQMPYDYSLMKLDLMTGEYTVQKWNVTGAEKQLARKHVIPGKQRWDTALYGLDCFLDDIVSGALPTVEFERLQYYCGLITNADGTSGNKIHEYVKECVIRSANICRQK